MHVPKPRFSELLRQRREIADQSTEVMAILLNLEEAEYLAIEGGTKYPDNETLRRLCMMMEWNYYDTQRIIINEMAAPTAAGPLSSQGAAAMRALQTFPLDKPGKIQDSLGNRLKEVRQRTGQTADIIALLLQIDVDAYMRLEGGEDPGDELLRRISMVYDWNFHDLITLLRSEQARTLQPRRIGSPFPQASARSIRLKSLVGELDLLFARLSEKDQQFVLTQLELIRETMGRLQQDS